MNGHVVAGCKKPVIMLTPALLTLYNISTNGVITPRLDGLIPKKSSSPLLLGSVEMPSALAGRFFSKRCSIRFFASARNVSNLADLEPDFGQFPSDILTAS